MLKVKHVKGGYRHDKVSQVKRQLVKAYKIVEGYSDIYAYIELTGVDDIDYKNVKYYLDKEYQKLNDNIARDIADEKEYRHGYSLRSKLTVVNFLIALEQVLSTIGDYPIIPTKTVDYKFKSTDIDQMWIELKEHFRENPVSGFNQEYYAVSNDVERRMYPITLDKYDLRGADKVLVKYQ